MMAVGVASPSAHGQAMISTATAATNPLAGSLPTTAQPVKVSAATASTSGTKTAEMRSARRCSWPLPVWACSTSWTIWARAVSAPTAVARMVNTPLVLTVAPATRSPGALSTGMLSPVNMDSSTALVPSSTSPSTGTFSPGRMRSRSPTVTCSTGTSTSAPSRSTRACLAPSSSRARMAWPARPRARASK
jgi:hypothetical protein